MEILSVEKVASMIDRSPGAIRNLVLRRKIPYRKAGGRLVFLRDEVERWIVESPGMTIDEVTNARTGR
jgi:hypothetical protein